MKIIDVKNLKFSYDGEKIILNDISFDIEQGEMVGLIGESGCGKSTLCHILCGIIPGSIGGDISGTAYVGGKLLSQVQLRDLSETIAFVMQDPDRQIVSSMVEDELAFGPENLCLEPGEIRRRVDRVSELLGLEKIRFENPSRLSGGQKQLTAIGSVLTLNPDIIVLDEPYSHLDEESRKSTAEVLQMLRKAGKTIIIVEHDYRLIKNVDRWIMLEDGIIKMQGKPEELIDKL